ncbi:ABC transporter ATP-binding protein [Alkalicoccobacillus porphyridii]|uniref:ATP-binding cassette domain-containing protein n=1 Tax=Alkalicoccobacillus porphyridii TaxID=2597270 RepID=A0A553ZUN2_9BACI|nr:ABC transporter transmembrane domain-containing protein [Alkalicoccobacillus porphyridii]TSB45167.1 ATP-binding cassette domain-containing protein [Alkalicoccobacillus porphyridii]
MKHEDRVLSGNEQRRILFRLLSYIKPHKYKLILALLLLFAATGAELLGPILVKIFIDDYLTPGQFPVSPIIWLASAYIILHICAVVISYIQGYMFQEMALKIIQSLRMDVFKNVQKLGLSFFDNTPTGGLISRITNDTESIKDLYLSVLAVFVQNFLFLLGTFVAMFYLNATLALYCLIFLPLILLLMSLYRKMSAKFYADLSGKLSHLNGKMNESIQGMTIVQMFRQEKRLRKEFAEVNDSHMAAGLKAMKVDGLLLRPMVDILAIAALVVVLSYFGLQSLQTTIEIGVLYAFISYLDRFFEPVNQIMMRLSMYQQAIVSAGRVFLLMDHQEYAPRKKGEENTQINIGTVEFKNVTFSYDQKTDVLKNISFKVNQGETLALVGHSGSGKSSIINLLMRFYEPQKGEILIDGKSLSSFSNEELRNNVGLVLQDSFLYSGTIKSNITLDRHTVSEEAAREAAALVGANQFIEKLPLKEQTEISERGSTLSSGQRQLISFARTMAHKPSILVLDEATANIDTESEELIQKALQRMQTNRTTIAIAHRLSTIKDANRIIVMHQGEIVESGTHEELIRAQGLYKNMYELQKGSEAVSYEY